MAALTSVDVREGPEKDTVLVCRVVGLVVGLGGVWERRRRGSAGCLPSRVTGLPVVVSCLAELTEVDPAVEGLVEAVAP